MVKYESELMALQDVLYYLEDLFKDGLIVISSFISEYQRISDWQFRIHVLKSR
jgi:hypothetical protein